MERLQRLSPGGAVFGEELTIQRVPRCKISASYLLNRVEADGTQDGFFLGDNENEMHVDLSDCATTLVWYAGTVRSGEQLKPYFDRFVEEERKWLAAHGKGRADAFEIGDHFPTA